VTFNLMQDFTEQFMFQMSNLRIHYEQQFSATDISDEKDIRDERDCFYNPRLFPSRKNVDYGVDGFLRDVEFCVSAILRRR
jgi:hypothetical protein